MPADWPAETSPSTVKMPVNLCRASDLAQAATTSFRDRRRRFGARGTAAWDAVKTVKRCTACLPLIDSDLLKTTLTA